MIISFQFNPFVSFLLLILPFSSQYFVVNHQNQLLIINYPN